MSATKSPLDYNYACCSIACVRLRGAGLKLLRMSNTPCLCSQYKSDLEPRTMEGENNILEDYLDNEKLEMYERVMLNLPTGKHLVTYNIKRLMPDVKGKTVLDLPCGAGHYIREMFNLGAAKVIASDLAANQLQLSKARDKKVQIPEGFVQYYQHDARIPKQICPELADVCLSFHLFCFAKNEGELRGMVRTLLANLKPGGCCAIITCSMNSSAGDEESVRNQLESIIIDEKLIHLDPPTFERFKPRRHHIVSEGFHFNKYVH